MRPPRALAIGLAVLLGAASAQADPPVASATPPAVAGGNAAPERWVKHIAVISFMSLPVLLAGGIAFSVQTINQTRDAQDARAQLHMKGGPNACSKDAQGAYGWQCKDLYSLWRGRDSSVDYRNAFFILSGAFATVGVAATVWAYRAHRGEERPAETKVSVVPGGVVLQGSF